MNDYELLIANIEYYKDKQCELRKSNCNKCEAGYECCGIQCCSFNHVIGFIKYVNGDRT